MYVYSGCVYIYVCVYIVYIDFYIYTNAHTLYIYIFLGILGCREFRGTMLRNCARNFKHLRPKFKNHRRFFQEAGQKSRN